jgi:hypothetical protein
LTGTLLVLVAELLAPNSFRSIEPIEVWAEVKKEIDRQTLSFFVRFQMGKWNRRQVLPLSQECAGGSFILIKIRQKLPYAYGTAGTC